jgi:cell division protein FtsW
MGMLRSLLSRKPAEPVRRTSLSPDAERRESSVPPAHPVVTGPADAVLSATVIALVAFGVVMVYSSSAVFALQRFGTGQHFLLRQGVYALVGLSLMAVIARLDYHRLRPLTYPFLFSALVLLCITAFGFGHSAGGAARWINLGPIHIQPAEIVKLAMIVWLAYSLSKKTERIRSFSVGFLPHILGAGVVMLLCLKQPDFGSAVMVGLITSFMLFAAGARLGFILGTGLLALPAVYFLVAGSEYRMRRITAFLSPFEHRHTAGYQIAESLMSFGAGGVSGVGLGDSRQKLLFLPEAHTDFISAIIGEELGFVGFAVVVCAFLVIVARGLRASLNAVDELGAYLAVGITLFLGTQAFTNLAVAVGLLPTKGLVLPFISYGGSSLLMNCMAVGILLNVSRPRERTGDERDERTQGKAAAGTSMQPRIVGGVA